MERNKLHDLMQRYLARECSADEKRELALLISIVKDEELKSQLLDQWAHFNSEATLAENRSQQIFQNILTSPAQEEVTIPKKIKQRSFNIRIVAAVAASVAILVTIGLFEKESNHYTAAHTVVAKASIIPPQKQASFTRNITLPDGSTVVLHAGSTIDYPAKFAGKTREITLVGEAYFDVKHMNSKPFIIHTGVVKTTVLGTAFDIKAWAGQKEVTVLVTRGKVRVEDDKKVLAVLTVNQSVNYNLRNMDAKQQTVNAEEVVNDWTKQDMLFNRVPFESIAQVLSKRYGKNIIITNAQLANTQITSSFSGMESLENILDILCAINVNTQYAINANEVTITSKN